MNRDIRSFVDVVVETFELPEPIWEIGSYLVTGQEAIADLRPLFAGKEFCGLDMRAGPGVDRIENVEKINAPDDSVGSILCLNTFEHVQNIYAGASEIHRVLKPGGVLVMTTPFDFLIHDFPGDYWRFTPQALELLTARFGCRVVGYQGYAEHPHNTFAIAFKHDNTEQVQAVLELFKTRLGQAIVGKPISTSRRVKLALARALVGDRFFRTHDHCCDLDMWIVKPAPSAASANACHRT